MAWGIDLVSRARAVGRCAGEYRGSDAGDGEALTSAELAQQTCSAQSGSRLYGPWGFSYCGSYASQLGEHAVRRLGQRVSGRSRHVRWCVSGHPALQGSNGNCWRPAWLKPNKAVTRDNKELSGATT